MSRNRRMCLPQGGTPCWYASKHSSWVKTEKAEQDTVLWELYIEREYTCTGAILNFSFTSRICSFQTTRYHLIHRYLKLINMRVFTRADPNYKMFNTNLVVVFAFVHFFIQIFRIKLVWVYKQLVLPMTKS